MANIETDVFSGDIEYEGNLLHSTSADLVGFNAYSISPQCTVDQYYLSDDIDSFALPDMFYYPGFASAAPLSLNNATLTVNLPETSVTFSITGASKQKSYMDDYYYRIHISQREIDFGNILAGISKSVTLWNAYLNSVTLTDIEYINTDATIDSPVPPQVLFPLQEISSTISVLTDGMPIINGTINFEFDIGEAASSFVYLGITGIRVVIWPYIPNVNFTEIREWITDVIPTYFGEERHIIREVPRLELNYTCEFHNLQDYMSAQALAYKSHNRSLALPLITDFRPYRFNINIGATVLTMPTANLELKAGGQLMIWESVTKVEVLEILSLTATSVTLRYPTQNNYTNAWVAPAFIGFTQDTRLNLQIDDSKKKTINVNIISLEPYNTSSISSYTLFQNLPVIDDIPIITGGLPTSFYTETNVIDSTLGTKTNLDVSENKYHSMQLSMKAIDEISLWKYRRLLDYFKGKYQPFFIPSRIELTTNVAQVNIGSNQFLAYGRFLTLYPPKYLKLNSSPPMYVEVSEINTTGLPEDQVSIIITTTTTVVLPINSKIEMLYKVRLDTDRIELNHPDRVATDIKPMLTIIQE